MIIIVPLIYMFKEHKTVIEFNFTNKFLFLLCLSGFLSFFVGYATSLQIQHTSPLTHNISGTAKSCFQTILGVIYYNETKNLNWCLSNLLAIIGALFYSIVRNKEMNSKKQSNNSIENKV